MGLFDFLRGSKPAPVPTAAQVAAVVLPQVLSAAETLVRDGLLAEIARIEMDVVTEAELANALRDAEPNQKTIELVQQAFDQVGGGTSAPGAWDGIVRDAGGHVAMVIEVDDTARKVWLACAPGWTVGAGRHSDSDTVASLPEENPPATTPEFLRNIP